MPPAPGRFSTTICWPSASDIFGPMMRVIVSGRPPGAYGTTILIGLVGNSCACAVTASKPTRRNASRSIDRSSSEFQKVYCPDEAPTPHVRLLGLRPHARARRRPHATRRHRAQLPDAAGGRNLLSHAAQPRVRLLGDVAVLVCSILERKRGTFRRHPRVPLALLQAFVHLRLGAERHSPRRGPERQAHRRAGVPDDRAGVDPRHPVRRLRPAVHGFLASLRRRRVARAPRGNPSLSCLNVSYSSPPPPP